MAFFNRELVLGRNPHYDKGIRLLDQGLYQEAITEFEQVGTSDLAVYRLARFHLGQAYAELGQRYLQGGLLERAEAALRRAIEIHPRFADLHCHLGIALRRQGRCPEAIEALNHALQINPRFAYAKLQMALCYLQMSEKGRGWQTAQEAVALEPRLHTSDFQKAMQALEEDNLTGAIAALEQVRISEVEDIQFHTRLGDDLYRRGMYDRAAEEYRKALHVNGEYPDLYNRLGVALLAQGDYSGAEEALRRALELNPRYAEAQANLVLALRGAGKQAEAQQALQRLAEIAPDSLLLQSAG
ncbi:MAG: tetratricopeptide repeat protein [Armatimonadota bacterium]|nr:tetratricopeptide repeat protein [bacterium]MCS7310130.1 tetratricopeptide repeat protein [Armatimonadota bacterium]MDW8104006.1 tetratricopeptide repeat protein [Armatimonadota bacterium]MDW8290442.1 tetratricopeptide repeat protein [Armatimonadota bacterium]